MGEYYVNIWAHCSKELARELRQGRQSADEGDAVRRLLFWGMFLLSLILVLVDAYLNERYLLCVAALFVILLMTFALCIVTAISQRMRPLGQLARFRFLSTPTVKRFLAAVELEPHDIPDVINCVKRYQEERIEKRKRFMNSVFTFLVCGLLVAFSGSAFQLFVNGQPDEGSMLLFYGLSAGVIAVVMLSCWDIADTLLHNSSLNQSSSMIAALECAYMYGLPMR